jgi:molybdenum cofactor cytidylyltransferase
VGAVILAAGESARMGTPKPLLELAGETFLERILATLARLEGLGARLVVLGHRAGEVRQSVHFHGAVPFTHRGYRRGMLSSLQAGCKALLRRDGSLEAVLVCLVDQPFVEAETYAALLNAFQPESDDVVIASYHGDHGHPVVLARTLVDRLVDDRQAGSLKEFIEQYAEGRRYVDSDDPAVVQNVNTPEAYEALRQPEQSS